MIISVSRRTDIPACYPRWFSNRLKEGYVMVRNPRNPNRLGYVALSPEWVDCIVFWTKNPIPFMDTLKMVERLGYSYYFEFTLTPYDRTIEPNLPQKSALMETFMRLSSRTGSNRVDWRYDPVIINSQFTVSYHLDCFGEMCRRLHDYTQRCIFSFADPYEHIADDFCEVRYEDKHIIAREFSRIASEYHLPLVTCAETIDLSKYGIGHSNCIDKEKIESIIGCPITAKKDSAQRPACGCIASVDIGAYDTCLNGCRYCYATTSKKAVCRKAQEYDPDSPLLTGRLRGDEFVTDRTSKSLKIAQTSLFYNNPN